MSSLKMRYENFCKFMENNTKGVEIGIYSVSGLLFAVSYLKIRPITKFGKAFDIPRHFITKKVIQKGSVKAIEPHLQTGAILKVDHKPPINLFFASQKTLPVKIFGINLNANGYSWLQTVTVNHPIEFLPIVRKHDYAECQVKLIQNPAISSKPRIDLAEALISLGFARLDDAIKQSDKTVISTDVQLKKYYDHLDKAQAKAKRYRLGVWSSLVKPPPWPLDVLEKKITKIIHEKVLPQKMRLPELVR